MTDKVDVNITLYVFVSDINILNLALLHKNKHKAKKLIVAVIHRHPNNRFNYMHPFICW